MHLDEVTHEHAVNARPNAFAADFEVDGSTNRWTAKVRQADQPPREMRGTLEAATPAAGVIAEQAVRDAVVLETDRLDLGV